MKATIYKNDDFETVGIRITHADVNLFKWGTTWDDGYFTKTINADKYTREIMEIFELNAKVELYRSGGTFSNQVFNLMMEDVNKERFEKARKVGVNFDTTIKLAHVCEDRMIELIKSIK